MASSRSAQHAESLKWQQEVFHRLLHLLCLAREGLAAQDQVDGCRAQILAFLRSSHPDGEWPEFTRDKLLFLQVSKKIHGFFHSLIFFLDLVLLLLLRFVLCSANPNPNPKFRV
jgi:hypothetical protein